MGESNHMWDRPDVLNAIATVLFSCAVVAIGYGLVLATVRLPVFPLREVRVSGTAGHVTRDQIEAAVRRELRGNFFTIDLAVARRSFERLPWVRQAEVRRHWPDRLDIAIEEHVALARWGDTALVNTHGEVFRAASDVSLPVFSGPEGSAKEIAIQYAYFHRSLAAIGQVPRQVIVTPRRAWRIRLENGLTLEVGRDQVEERLARFVGAYDQTIGRLARRIDHVDLRYPNGFAVRIPELKRIETGKKS